MTYPNGDCFQGIFDEDSQEGVAKWGEWKVQGQLKENEFDGNTKITKPGTIIQASFSQGYQEGLMKIQKKVKQETISYRGEF